METMSSPVRMLSDKILMYNNVVIGKKTDPFSLKPHFGRQAFDNHGGILLKKRCEDIKTKVDFEGWIVEYINFVRESEGISFEMRHDTFWWGFIKALNIMNYMSFQLWYMICK